mmetsp:Transcript_42283/g.83011  ORF Transcript_42283/g.83011 Transcript_42283/m.83011 type:complete len:316 (-) Transcript_42283:23-970(-)
MNGQRPPKFDPHDRVIVLGGWFGCARKSLGRYERIYRDDLGYGAVLVSLPSDWRELRDATLRSGPNADDGRAEKMLDAVGSRRWIFHGFSNGGSFLWEAVLRVLRARLADGAAAGPRPRWPDGTIFDSSPAKYGDIGDFRRAMAATYPPSDLAEFDRLERGAVEAAGECAGARGAARAASFWEGMRTEDAGFHVVPEVLYLFGADDPLTSSRPLMELIRHRQDVRRQHPSLRSPPATERPDAEASDVEVGRHVGGISWVRFGPPSLHCGHLRTHPDAYVRAVAAFDRRVCAKVTGTRGLDGSNGNGREHIGISKL